MALNSITFIHEQNIKLEEKLNSDDIQLWNVLLYHVYDNLFHKDEHSIPVSELLRLWSEQTGYKTEKQLKKSLNRLGTKITYVLKNEKRKRCGFFVLLSWIYISNDVCYFSYSNKFKQLVHYPKIAHFLNKKGITCAQQLLYPPKNPFLGMPIENLNYYTRIFLRSNSLINKVQKDLYF